MSQKSIHAIQTCMAFLGLRVDRHIHKPVGCSFRKIGGSTGPMYVTFQNDVHAHEGPYLTFDDTIRGFGIGYQEFKPRYQHFKFTSDETSGTLTCKGEGYAFSLTFWK